MCTSQYCWVPYVGSLPSSCCECYDATGLSQPNHYHYVILLHRVFEIIDQNIEARTRRAQELTTDTTSAATSTTAVEDSTTSSAVPLTLQGVSFTYASRPEVPVLRDVTVTLQPNRFTCFAGKSGAGKSTLVAVLSGLLFPQQGRILVGERVLLDATQLTSAAKERGAHWLHTNVGVVQQQDKSLMSGSIRDNIEYGKVRTLLYPTGLLSVGSGTEDVFSSSPCSAPFGAFYNRARVRLTSVMLL